MYNTTLANQALTKLGSTYQMPVAQSVQQAPAVQPTPQEPAKVATFAAPAQAPVATAQGAAPVPADTDKEKAAPAAGGLQNAGQALSGMQGMSSDDKTNEGMKKVGTLVGTILSFYTGNYGGGAKGVEAMKEQQTTNG